VGVCHEGLGYVDMYYVYNMRVPMPHQMHLDEIARALGLLMITPPHAKSSWTTEYFGGVFFLSRKGQRRKIGCSLLFMELPIGHTFSECLFTLFWRRTAFYSGRKSCHSPEMALLPKRYYTTHHEGLKNRTQKMPIFDTCCTE